MTALTETYRLVSVQTPNTRTERRSMSKKKEKTSSQSSRSIQNGDSIDDVDIQKLAKKQRSLSRHDIAKEMFNHSVYDKAAMLFERMSDSKKSPSESNMLPTFDTEFEKRRVFSLAFATKRYEAVLKDVLLDSSFYSRYFKLETFHHTKVMVMLLDFYQHGFRFSQSKRLKISESSHVINYIGDIQAAFFDQKIRICSAFARNRIKACALTLDGLLPPEVKEQGECASRHPLYARVNTLLTDRDTVMQKLKETDFELCSFARINEEQYYHDDENLEHDSNNNNDVKFIYAVDDQFENLLVFPPYLKDDVYNSDLAVGYHIIPQSKPRHLIVELLNNKLHEVVISRKKNTPLIPNDTAASSNIIEGPDVVLTHPESGSLCAHICSCIHPNKKLFVFGCRGNKKKELESSLKNMGAYNFELFSEDFSDFPVNNQLMETARIIICNPQSSLSGVVNPVDFILHEGAEYADLLSHQPDSSKLNKIMDKQRNVLRHAMRFLSTDTVIYFTHSTHDRENEKMLKDCLEETNTAERINNREGFRMSPLLTKLRHHLKDDAHDEDSGLAFQPSTTMDGFYLAVIQRTAKEETAREILDRAAKKGLVTKSEKQTKKSPGSGKKLASELRPSPSKSGKKEKKKRQEDGNRGFKF